MAQSGSDKQRGSNKKVANRLVAASCAGVLSVYVAGYARTQSAANRLTAQIAERRSTVAGPVQAGSIRVKVLPTTPSAPAIEGLVSTNRRREETRTSQIESLEPAPVTATVQASVQSILAEPSPAEAPELSSTPAPVVAIITAPTVIPAAPVPPPPPPALWKDGTYTGWGYSRHGNIEAAVVIEGGRIASATISQCRTRYSCSVIDMLPPQVAKRQSPDVDYVSGATQSADAFYGAVVEALGKAK